MNKITLAIITFKRPDLLYKTLDSLRDLAVPTDSVMDIVIIDNDVEKSAGTIVRESATTFPYKLRYVVESRKGRGHARNKALEESQASDYLVFIDDDIILDKDWLLFAFQTSMVFDAHIVAGKARYHLPDNAPGWTHDCRYFRSEVQRTGKILSAASTNNMIIDRQWIQKEGIRFPEQTVGEDTVFCVDAIKRGARIVGCAEALADTWVTPERLTPGWVLRRTIRYGAIRAGTLRRHYRPHIAVLMSLRQALKRCKNSLGAFVLAAVGRRPWIRCVEHAGWGIGWLAGALGCRSLLMTDA